ncbi:SGNH/GDSL hydrolase family protein, partial [Arthrobacter sp. AL08]|nr:SGNH/GDSL hydrolase family protein [Arthrobacter sp. AL08]
MQSPPRATEAHPWSRYVAMGDSFTEGIGDPDPT